jgi:hypothetical protein
MKQPRPATRQRPGRMVSLQRRLTMRRIPSERFWSKIQKKTACLEWQGSRDKEGYGGFWNGITQRAHRYSWELHHGPIPHGMSVLHTCDNPSCVRPDHLYLGTQLDNMRSIGTRPSSARNALSRCETFRRRHSANSIRSGHWSQRYAEETRPIVWCDGNAHRAYREATNLEAHLKESSHG